MAFTLTGMTILAVAALVGLLLIATIVVANMDLHLTDLPSDPIEKNLKRGVITTNPVITSDELQNEQDENLEEIQANPLVIGAGISGILNLVDEQVNQEMTDGNNALANANKQSKPWEGFEIIIGGGGGKEPDKDPDKKPDKKQDKDLNKDPDKDPNINPIKITAQIGAVLLVPTLIGNMLNVDTVGDDGVISPFDTSYIVRVCDTGTGQVIIQYTDGTQRIFDKKDVPQNILAMAGQDVNDKGGTNSSKKEGTDSSTKGASKSGQYSGELVKVNKPDAAADALAERIGGESRVKFDSDPNGREFDVVSDEYIAQAKPDLQSYGKSWRKQVKATFEAAKETGRKAYFQFEGEPSEEIVRRIQEYAERYGVEYIIDTTPLGVQN